MNWNETDPNPAKYHGPRGAARPMPIPKDDKKRAEFLSLYMKPSPMYDRLEPSKSKHSETSKNKKDKKK